MASNRKFGIVTQLGSDLVSGIVVNSLTKNKSVEVAEARDEKGKLIDIAAYSQNETVSVQGLTVGDGVTPGTVAKIGDKNFLIASASETESNTAFAEQSLECRTADEIGYIWPYGAVDGNDAVAVSGTL